MSPAAFAAIGLALLAVALGMAAVGYRQRWKRAAAEAAAAAARAARGDAVLAAAPLGCLAITPSGDPGSEATPVTHEGQAKKQWSRDEDVRVIRFGKLAPTRELEGSPEVRSTPNEETEGIDH